LRNVFHKIIFNKFKVYPERCNPNVTNTFAMKREIREKRIKRKTKIK